MRRRLHAITLLLAALALAAAHARAAQGAKRVPTVDDLLSLKTLGGARISPDGRWVAYTVSEANFKADAFVTQIWIADTATGRRVQLTKHETSIASFDWSPDGRTIIYASPLQVSCGGIVYLAATSRGSSGRSSPISRLPGW